MEMNSGGMEISTFLYSLFQDAIWRAVHTESGEN